MENVAAMNSSGIALTMACKTAEAISVFKDALSLEPDNSLLWLNLGLAQQKSGDYEAALSSFQRSVSCDQSEDCAWTSMGLIYYELGKFEISEQCYQNALNIEAAKYGVLSAQTLNNMGVLFFNQGRDEEARGCFERALVTFPLYADALFNLRDVCMRLGDRRSALEADRRFAECAERWRYRA